MRIEHVVDPSHVAALVHQRVLQPSTTAPPRRIQAINRQADPQGRQTGGSETPDDGINLALSPEGREAARQAALEALRTNATNEDGGQATQGQEEDPYQKAEQAKSERAVQELESRDRELRSREQVRAASAGGLGTVSYTYQVGPDGRLYAVSAETKLDTSPVMNDPEATLRKAVQIQEAAFAPGSPSGEARRAAAVAAEMAARARQELARQEADQKQTERQLDEVG